MSNDVMQPNAGWFRRPESKVQEPYDKANEQGIVLAQEARRLRDRNDLASADATFIEATSFLRKACESEPNLHHAFFNLGVILLEQSALVRARLEPERALALLDEAEAQFQKALDIEPSLVVAQNNLGSVAFERAWHLYDLNPAQAENQFAQCEAHSRRLLEMQPDWADAENNLGNAIYERGGLVRKRAPEEASALYREAETHYRRALEIDPNCFNAERYWGRVLFTLSGFLRERARPGTLELCIESEAHYQRALELKPGAVEVLDDLSSVLLWKAVDLRALGRSKEVSKAVADVLRLGRQYLRQTGRPTYNLACALALTGDAELAVATLEDMARGGVRFNPAYLRRDSDLDTLREHPRFQALLKQLEGEIS